MATGSWYSGKKVFAIPRSQTEWRFVAMDDGAIVGTLDLKVIEDQGEEELYASGFNCTEGWAAPRLWLKARRLSRDLGFKTVVFLAEPGSPMLRFLEKGKADLIGYYLRISNG